MLPKSWVICVPGLGKVDRKRQAGCNSLRETEDTTDNTRQAGRDVQDETDRTQRTRNARQDRT
eukprot:11172435-Lingulodinium_polyedra.AAC.1